MYEYALNVYDLFRCVFLHALRWKGSILHLTVREAMDKFMEILYSQQLRSQHLITSILIKSSWVSLIVIKHLKIEPHHIWNSGRGAEPIWISTCDCPRFLALDSVTLSGSLWCSGSSSLWLSFVWWCLIVMHQEEINFSLQRLTSREVVLPSTHPPVLVVQTYQVTVPALGCCPRWYTGMDILVCCNSP